MTPTGPQAEYLTNPTGLDVVQPQLSWRLQAMTDGALLFQTIMEAHRDDLIYSMVSQEDYPG